MDEERSVLKMGGMFDGVVLESKGLWMAVLFVIAANASPRTATTIRSRVAFLWVLTSCPSPSKTSGAFQLW
jgi:hypothetical protein